MKTVPAPQKRCFKCRELKPLTDFYKHPQMADGHLNKCKACAKRDVHVNRGENLEYYRQYDRDRANLPKRVAARASYDEAYIRTHPQRKTANVATNNALRDRRIKKTPCEICGDPNSEAHHEDYSKPLEVRWLCKPHHYEADDLRRLNEAIEANLPAEAA